MMSDNTMRTKTKCKFIALFIAICSVLYVIGSGIYIIYLMALNHQLMDTSHCPDIDTSRGMILEKDNDSWNQRYTVIRPSGGVVELKCPTMRPIYYFIFNQLLTGYMELNDMSHRVNITGCNNLIRYYMRVGEAFPIMINQTLVMASVVIWQNDLMILYVKHNVYRTYDIDLYNEWNEMVANLKYTDRWTIVQYQPVDHLIFLSLVGYHQLYIDGMVTDRCNQFVMVMFIIIASVLMLVCCYCGATMIKLYRRVDSDASYRIDEKNEIINY